jgi:hypothetical protein
MSKRKPVLPGERFQKSSAVDAPYLTAIAPDRLVSSGSKGKKKAKVRCVCSCDEKKEVDAWVYNLRSSHTTSCGCHQADVRNKNAKHLSEWREQQTPKWTLGRIRATDILKYVDILDERPDGQTISQRDKIKVRCKACGKEREKDAVEIERYPEACRKCAGKEPWTAGRVRAAIEGRRELLKTDGINKDTCPDDTLINLLDRRKFRCVSCHSTVNTSVMTAVRLKTAYCNKCKPDKQWTLGRFRNEVEAQGGEVTDFLNESDDYPIYSDQRIELKCEYGHLDQKTPNHLRDGGQICSECTRKRGERVVRAEFEAVFGQPFPATRPRWLDSPKGKGYKLELDGYNESLALAFEHDGPQHYGVKIRPQQTDKALESIQEYDRHKDMLCSQFGVDLIRVPTLGDKVPWEQARAFIVKECRKRNIKVPFLEAVAVVSPVPEDLRYFEEFKRLVEDRGGIVLAERYLGSNEKLEVQCANDHTFSIAPHKLKEGRWCRTCYDEKQTRDAAARYGYKDYRERLVSYLAESKSSLVAPNSGVIKASTTVEIACRCGATRPTVAASVLVLKHHGLCRSCWQQPA